MFHTPQLLLSKLHPTNRYRQHPRLGHSLCPHAVPFTEYLSCARCGPPGSQSVGPGQVGFHPYRTGEAGAGSSAVRCSRSPLVSGLFKVTACQSCDSNPNLRDNQRLDFPEPCLLSAQAQELPKLAQMLPQRVCFPEIQFGSHHLPPPTLAGAPLSWRFLWISGVTDDLGDAEAAHGSSPRVRLHGRGRQMDGTCVSSGSEWVGEPKLPAVQVPGWGLRPWGGP